MGGMKNTQSKMCLFIDSLLAYMITDDQQIFIEIYLFIFTEWEHKMDFTWFSVGCSLSTKNIHQSSFQESSFQKTFPWKIFFIFKNLFFYRLSLSEPQGTFLGPFWDLLGTFLGPFRNLLGTVIYALKNITASII